MLYNLHFFSSKCRLFHNATLFGFCITHILNTECAEIWKKKIRRQKVKLVTPLGCRMGSLLFVIQSLVEEKYFIPSIGTDRFRGPYTLPFNEYR